MPSPERRSRRGVVIGAGDRGANAYAPLLLERPELGSILAVAEPNAARRRAFAARFGIPEERCFDGWSGLLERPALADYAIVATPDAEHAEPALRALERGYAVLLEKPMATDEADCERLVAAAERSGRILQVCHVLRYAPLYRAVRQIVASGEIGEVLTIQHSENVSYWHYAHSYCRGHWRNRAGSSPMILAKSCHDLDILCWLAGAEPLRLSSLERPTWLCEANAPADAPERCIDGCPHAERCPYDAVAMYRDLSPLLLDVAIRSLPAVDAAGASETAANRQAEGRARPPLPRAEGWSGWPISVITDDPTPEGVEHALRTTRYGRCVYRVGDNDQPASQHVGLLFANGVNASFTMHSSSYREGRETRIDGTMGSIVAGLHTLEQFVRVHDHKTGGVRIVDLPAAAGNHGGADPRLFEAFLAAVRGESEPETSAAESLWSHRMAFAADRAAREGVVVEWSRAARRARG